MGSHPTRNRKSTQSPDYQYLAMTDNALLFLTEQMSAKCGFKELGQAGVDAIQKELEQLLYCKVMHGVRSSDLMHKQKCAVLQYQMFLKQNCCWKGKGHGCADGWKQRVYKTKEDTSSPTISVEALLLTCLIDAMDVLSVSTCDRPGAFIQVDMDEKIHMHLDGELAELLMKVGPIYKQFIAYECNKPVIYTELDKALYGTLQAALLFWRKLRSFLIDTLRFQVNHMIIVL